MITDLIVEDYQSLHRVKVPLGKLTVVTGPSSSGKTALFRALELVAFNARGKSFISRGASKTVVGVASQPEGWAAAITRGERGADSYRVSVLDPDNPDEPKVWEYTKLASKVPDDAAAVVNLRELNFSGQFDPPFLLRESAGEVARILGQLTNVTLIFRAAQEAARRRKAMAADLRAAEAELDRLRTEAQRFAGLQNRVSAVQQAELALAGLQGTQVQAARLEAALGRLRAAQGVLGQVLIPPDPPDLSELEASVARAERLRSLILTHGQASAVQARSAEEIAAYERQESETEQQIDVVLDAAGICPTCGSRISREQHAARPSG